MIKNKATIREFPCDDEDARCGKLRIINMGDRVEICHMPLEKPERYKRCVVMHQKDILKLIKFLQ